MRPSANPGRGRETAAVLLEADVDDRRSPACTRRPPLRGVSTSANTSTTAAQGRSPSFACVPWTLGVSRHRRRAVVSRARPGEASRARRAHRRRHEFSQTGHRHGLEARRRGTTTYLIQRPDMLPKPLTEISGRSGAGWERLPSCFSASAATGDPRRTPRLLRQGDQIGRRVDVRRGADDDGRRRGRFPLANICGASIDARGASRASRRGWRAHWRRPGCSSSTRDVRSARRRDVVTREANQMVEEMISSPTSRPRGDPARFPSRLLEGTHPRRAHVRPAARRVAAGVAVDVSSSRALAVLAPPSATTILLHTSAIVATRCCRGCVLRLRSARVAGAEALRPRRAAAARRRFDDTPTSSSTGCSTPRSAWRSRTTRAGRGRDARGGG